MHADEFLATYHKPSAWYRRSHALRLSAKHLHTRIEALDDLIKEDGRDVGTHLTEQVAHINAARLLYGLALETALKGKFLERFPGDVRVAVVIDGNQKVVEVALDHIGVSPGKGSGAGHNLRALAARVGVVEKTFLEEYRAAVYAHLDELSDAVVWHARYPVPLHAKAGDSAKGYGLVDKIIAPLLDALLPAEEKPDAG
jgi:hypothetical protein